MFRLKDINRHTVKPWFQEPGLIGLRLKDINRRTVKPWFQEPGLIGVETERYK